MIGFAVKAVEVLSHHIAMDEARKNGTAGGCAVVGMIAGFFTPVGPVIGAGIGAVVGKGIEAIDEAVTKNSKNQN